jgi:hypothetical protein
MISSWVSTEESIYANAVDQQHKKMIRKGAGIKPRYVEMEEELITLVKKRQDEGRVASRRFIIHHANVIG